MKTLNLLFVTAILFLSACASVNRGGPVLQKEVTDTSLIQTAGDGYRRRLVAMPFIDSNPQRAASLREKANRAFLSELSRSKDLIVIAGEVDRSIAPRLVNESGYVMKEVCAEAANKGFSLVLDGKLLEVKIKRKSDRVGVLRKVATQFEIQSQVRVHSTRGCKEVFNTVKTVTFDEQGVRVAESANEERLFADNKDLIEVLIKDAFLEFVPQVMTALRKVAFEGRIASISGDRIYLNVGKNSGIQVGDILKVLDPGEDIYDPDSGLHLGKATGRLKGTIEVTSYFGVDGAIATVHSGAGFKENDRIENY